MVRAASAWSVGGNLGLATLPIPLWLHILPAGALAMGLMRILVMEMARSDRDRDLY